MPECNFELLRSVVAVLRSIFSVSVATVLSRITGYGRVMAMAAVLAGGMVAQAYGVATLLPSLIYELLLGGILYSIFIPVLIERRANHGEEDARSLTSALFTVMLPLMGVVALIGILLAEPLVGLTTQWDASQDLSAQDATRVQEIAVLFFRIFALQMLFYGVNTLATGVLQSHGRFFLPTFAPVLNNLITIGSFLAYPFIAERSLTLALYVLAGGATLGVAVMTLALVPTMFKLGYVPRLQIGHPALGPTMKLVGPMVILAAASVGFQFFAAFLATEFNAVAEITYAFTVFSVPYGILTVAITTVLMPELSEQHALGDTESYRSTFSLGLRSLAFVLVPASAGMIILAEPIVGLLYQRYAFDPELTQTVATLLAAYSIGLVGYSAYFFLVRAFYSRQNTKTPAMLNVLIFLIYIGFSYALSRYLQAPGIALALSASYAVLALASLAATRREIGRVDGRHLVSSLARILLAGVVMCLVAQAGVQLLGVGTGFWQRLAIVTIVGATSSAVYLGVAYMLKAEEMGYAVSIVKRILNKARSTGAGA